MKEENIIKEPEKPDKDAAKDDEAIEKYFLSDAIEERTDLTQNEINDFSVLYAVCEEMGWNFTKNMLIHKYRHKLSYNRKSRQEAIEFARGKYSSKNDEKPPPMEVA